MIADCSVVSNSKLERNVRDGIIGNLRGKGYKVPDDPFAITGE